MISVLINAYACSPGMGSEPGMAWNWCVNLARHCDLHIITEGEFRESIEKELHLLPQGGNMHFYYNPVSDKVRKMCWNQGDWRFYRYYKKWQWKTYKMAEVICREKHIDILHQLNMIGFREPGYLWKIKDIPFVWGPVDAKDSFPIAYLKGAGLKTRLFIWLKNGITKLQLKYSTRVHNAAKCAEFVVSASSNSKFSFEKYLKIDSILLNETGCYVRHNPIVDKLRKKTFDILWVGKLDFRKQLGIALRSIAKMNNKNVVLHIVGAGDNKYYKDLAKTLDISAKCVWYGNISHNAVSDMMQMCDVLFFTSVAEGTPHVVLEAIGNNLPIVCFNTCGQGDIVKSTIGRKIELSNPNKSVIEFSEILNDLEGKRDLLKQLSENCIMSQQNLSWERKAERMVVLYKNVLKKKISYRNIYKR